MRTSAAQTLGEDHVAGRDAASVREAAARNHSRAIPTQETSIAVQGAVFDQVVDRAALRRAARQCMGRLGGPGLDGMTWRQYRDGFRARIDALSCRLRNLSWHPSRTRNATLFFADKNLDIVVPTVEDRIVHRAVRNVLEPLIAHQCKPFVFGWVPRRPWRSAVQMAGRYLVTNRWTVDADVYRVTCGAAVEEVLEWLRPYTADVHLLRLVALILSSLPRPLAPGSGLTPMLTNLRLMPVDLALCAYRVVRYTDNYCIFTANSYDAHNTRAALDVALAALHLDVNEDKSCVRWNPDPNELFGSGCLTFPRDTHGDGRPGG